MARPLHPCGRRAAVDSGE